MYCVQFLLHAICAIYMHLFSLVHAKFEQDENVPVKCVNICHTKLKIAYSHACELSHVSYQIHTYLLLVVTIEEILNYCDSIAIVGSTIAIYYCDSCDTTSPCLLGL